MPGRNVVDLIERDQPFLAENEVRHVAEPIVPEDAIEQGAQAIRTLFEQPSTETAADNLVAEVERVLGYGKTAWPLAVLRRFADVLIEVPRTACRSLEFHRAAEVIEQIELLGGHARFVAADIGTAEGIQRLVDEADLLLLEVTDPAVHELAGSLSRDRSTSEIWEGSATLELFRAPNEEHTALAPVRMGKGFRFTFAYSVDDQSAEGDLRTAR